MAKVFRQGDLLFIKMQRKPQNQGRKQDNPILLEGEATGHAHKLTGDGEIYEPDLGSRLKLVWVNTKALVVHEEHGPIALDKGWWEVRRQREFDGQQTNNYRYVTD